MISESEFAELKNLQNWFGWIIVIFSRLYIYVISCALFS